MNHLKMDYLIGIADIAGFSRNQSIYIYTTIAMAQEWTPQNKPTKIFNIIDRTGLKLVVPEFELPLDIHVPLLLPSSLCNSHWPHHVPPHMIVCRRPVKDV